MLGPTPSVGILADVPVEYVPHTLSALESRKNRVFWETEADFINGYQGICLMQWGLLMDATNRIINEVRAGRDGPATPASARDPNLDPYELPLTSLATINAQLTTGGRSAAQILASIETIIQAQGTSDAEQLQALLRIATVVAGAI